jgi:hypothetical protein
MRKPHRPGRAAAADHSHTCTRPLRVSTTCLRIFACFKSMFKGIYEFCLLVPLFYIKRKLSIFSETIFKQKISLRTK